MQQHSAAMAVIRKLFDLPSHTKLLDAILQNGQRANWASSMVESLWRAELKTTTAEGLQSVIADGTAWIAAQGIDWAVDVYEDDAKYLSAALEYICVVSMRNAAMDVLAMRGLQADWRKHSGYGKSHFP